MKVIRRTVGSCAKPMGSAAAVASVSTMQPFLVARRPFASQQWSTEKRRTRMANVAGYNGVVGYDDHTKLFEQSISLIEFESYSQFHEGWNEDVAIVELVDPLALEEPVVHPSPIAGHTVARTDIRPRDEVSQLAKNGDSTFRFVDGKPLISVINPFLRSDVFRPPEAQVEIMSAFRNVLLDLHSSKATTLRIMPLSMETSGPMVADHLPRINHCALVKAFQRMNNRFREELVIDRKIRVELYVMPQDMKPFLLEWQNDAMPPLTNNPEELTAQMLFPYYSNLPPPRQMLEYPGWVGKRQEIIDAINNQEPVKTIGATTLHGEEAYELDVHAEIPMLEDDSGKWDILRKEEETALAAGYEKIKVNPSAAAPAPDLPRFD